jgi:hypothetical protein
MMMGTLLWLCQGMCAEGKLPNRPVREGLTFNELGIRFRTT